MFDTESIWAALQGWADVLVVAGAAALLAELVFRLGSRLVMRAAAGSPAAVTVAQSIRGPAHLLVPLLAVTAVWHSIEDTLVGLAMVQRLCTMVTIAAATWLLVRALNGYRQAVIDANPLTAGDNLEARRIQTQTRVVTRTISSIIVLVGVSLMLITIPAVRQIGASLLASAGVIGLIAGFAARPVLGNMIAGLQIGLSQPIRIDDVVIVEGEWGVIEEITRAFVVVRIWDDRRLVVPLQYWVEKPFQNWTRRSADLTGTVTLWVDYRMPLEPLRQALRETCERSEHWDKRVALLQVTEAGERAMQLRVLVTAANAGKAWDLRCEVREALVAFVQREYPQYLPRLRVDDSNAAAAQAAP